MTQNTQFYTKKLGLLKKSVMAGLTRHPLKKTRIDYQGIAGLS